MLLRYLAFDVGCIECGEPSGIVGIYDTEEEAVEANKRAWQKQTANWDGQHAFLVFDLESENSYSQWSK